ncbi:ran-specific GTPase-activating protein-like [Euwallacea fornicatus]|uniref:ran-specific GTPase-activating protein-like n=1 Tax=Euwallacea fornicatus TaxID=995702 RepID=UPI00338EA1FD
MSEQVKIPETPETVRRDSELSDIEHDIHFSPILPEVQVSTNEEEEEVFLKLRAKLFRFSKTDPPEWKERGTGEMKILRHMEKNSYRLVMRRDKTLKVCANHYITPWVEPKASHVSERAYLYNVCDFADEKSKSECFAFRFATEENAKLFKSKFDEARKNLLTDCDLYNGKIDAEIRKEIEKNLQELEDEEKEANDLSEKLSELNVTKATEEDSDTDINKETESNLHEVEKQEDKENDENELSEKLSELKNETKEKQEATKGKVEK